MHDHTTACHQLSPTRGSLISKPKIPTFVVAPWESDVMMTAEPDYRWDGDRWWRWASGRWGPVSPADPQPRLAEVRTAPNRSDAELVASWMRFRGGTKKALRSLPSLLTSDEAVEFILAVELGDNQGILVLTSARLFFATNVRSPQIEFNAACEDVLDASVAAGRLRHPVTVHVRQSVARFSCVDAAAAEALVGLLTLRAAGLVLTTMAPGGAVISGHLPRNRVSGTSVPIEDEATAPVHATGQDSVGALADLTRMLELGLISQEEFAAKKAEILDRL